MANNDDYKVPPPTQGCSGYDCSGGQNQKNAQSDSSVSKKNFSANSDEVSSGCPCDNTEENDKMPTIEDAWKEVEGARRLGKSISDKSSEPLHAVNPQEPKNSPQDKGEDVPPTQGCFPKV